MTALDDILALAEGRFSLGDVAKSADMHINHLYDIQRGRQLPTDATLSRLRFAVSRLRMRQIEEGFERTICYRLALAMAAVALGGDPALAQVSDPARRQTNSAAWREAANARRLAQYVMNTTLGFRQVDVARAAGVTKQAINQALQKIEEQRDDAGFDAVVRKMESWVLGERG